MNINFPYYVYDLLDPYKGIEDALSYYFCYDTCTLNLKHDRRIYALNKNIKIIYHFNTSIFKIFT